MLAIRMRRTGSKKRPYFRVVVANSEAARDGSFVEILGHYNPRAQPETFEIKHDRVAYWLERGALPSDSVRTLLARHPVPAAPAASPEATAGPAQ
ncbi:MAG TPA: 30S ribosomal protein S16 [Vicinamibacterales bacterium]|nr:30S ribosomal protein S16 [Vicinamibacterales bacterium]